MQRSLGALLLPTLRLLALVGERSEAFRQLPEGYARFHGRRGFGHATIFSRLGAKLGDAAISQGTPSEAARCGRKFVSLVQKNHLAGL